ncbi:hypothetical protein [Bacillus pinisoli]|uniref:hypothetical protein n=1 Tax=Bacillus pinisoli TaxID=2901866 RepID=UPI001FF102A5|nr:hypothetical protein [Bacillus pinisoli]
MHPITVSEITISVFLVIVILGIALLVPKKVRRLSLLIASTLMLIMLLFFTIRPQWIDYQVSIKIDQLNQYLEEKYPNEVWEVRRQEGRQYNPYQLKVTFEGEKDWTYTYTVHDKKICQSAWSPPEGKSPSQGKYYDENCK